MGFSLPPPPTSDDIKAPVWRDWFYKLAQYITRGVVSIVNGGTGLSTLGTANQVLGMNPGATALEYKTISAGNNVTVTGGSHNISISAIKPGCIQRFESNPGAGWLRCDGSPYSRASYPTIEGMFPLPVLEEGTRTFYSQANEALVPWLTFHVTGNIYLAEPWGPYSNNTLLRSTDGGVTWSVITLASDYRVSSSIYRNATTGRVFLKCHTTANFFYSDDNGATWTWQTIGTYISGLNRYCAAYNDVDNAVYIYESGTTSIYVSKDGGTTFTNYTLPVTLSGGTINCMGIYSSDADTVHIIDEGGATYTIYHFIPATTPWIYLTPNESQPSLAPFGVMSTVRLLYGAYPVTTYISATTDLIQCYYGRQMVLQTMNPPLYNNKDNPYFSTQFAVRVGSYLVMPFVYYNPVTNYNDLLMYYSSDGYTWYTGTLPSMDASIYSTPLPQECNLNSCPKYSGDLIGYDTFAYVTNANKFYVPYMGSDYYISY